MARLASVILLLLGMGCAVGVRSYPSWTEPAPTTPPLSVQDVIKLLKESVSQEAILAKIELDGIEARPTAEEMIALKNACAGDRLLEGLMAARIPSRISPRREASEDYYFYTFPPFHPFPDPWPFYSGWYWYGGRLRPHPWYYGYRHLN